MSGEKLTTETEVLARYLESGSSDPYEREAADRLRALEREREAARAEVRAVLAEYAGEWKAHDKREKFYQAHIRNAWQQCAHRIGRALGMAECFPSEEPIDG